MKSKLLMFSVIALLLIGIVSADLIGIGVIGRIGIDRIAIDRIKTQANVQNIDVQIGQINCNSKECWASIYQENLIQTEWRREKSYCSEYEFNRTISESICVQWADYTLEENQQAIQEFIQKRLNDWAIVEEQRNNEIVDVVAEQGAIGE